MAEKLELVDIAKLLYSGAAPILVAGGDPVSTTGVATVMNSKHRGSGTRGGAAKLSNVAKLLDLLDANPQSMYTCWGTTKTLSYPEVLHVHFTDAGKARDLLFSRNDSGEMNVYYKGETPHHTLLYAMAIWQAWQNAELCEIFQSMTTGLNATAKKTAAYKFCDSFYYYMKAKPEAIFLTEHPKLDELLDNVYASCSALGTGEALKSFPLMQNPRNKKGNEMSEDVKGEGGATEFLDECKAGRYAIDYEWDSSITSRIVSPKFLDTFEPTTEFVEIVKKIYHRSQRILERMDMGLTGAEAIGKDALNIMLLGKPGTGKTTLAYALSATLRMPVGSTVHNKHTDEEEYEGKTKIVNGHPEFVETDSLMFHQFGGLDICEEINLTDPSVTMGGLGQKLEYPYIVKKNGYESIVRHPLNVVIATMNVGTNGSNPLNQALANRFKTPYILDDPTKDTFIGILMKASKKEKDVCKWVYEAYDRVKQYLISPTVNEDEICQNLSIRSCLGCIENMEEGQAPKRALINSIVGQVAMADVELARRVQEEVIMTLPNPKFTFA